MANEFKHVAAARSSAGSLTQAEFDGITAHRFDSQAQGDILYASSTTQLTRLAKGTAGALLVQNDGATAPSWSTRILHTSGNFTFQEATTVKPSASAHNAVGKALIISSGATTAGTTDNIAGGALTIQGGQGKGSGAGGDIIFQTANAGGSGSSVNALATALTLSDDLSAAFTGAITGTTIDASTDFTIGDTVITNGVITDSSGLQLAANLDINGTADISGDLTLSAGADGALVFSNAGENSIKIPDNQASALIIEEADNAYITFTTTNSSEAITVAKATTFSAALDINAAVDISGDLTLSAGADGALTFSNAGENSIKIPDNQASALIIEEADNAYMTFTTTNSSEAITIAKATTFSAAVDLGSNTLTTTGSLQIRTIDYSDGDLSATIADGGGITFAQDVTMTAGKNVVLGDGSTVNISAPLLAGADHTYSGTTAQMLAGGAISAFDLVCIHTVTGEIVEADASAIATARVIGIAPAAISDTATGTVLLHGFIRDDTWNWTTGGVLFLSETAGAMTHTAPTTDGAFVQAVGIALEPDVVFINPSLDLIEHG